MHVLAVVGSPRKGHSAALIERIEAMLRADGSTTVEVVLLGSLNLQPCRGCYVCQAKGEAFCPLKDELATLVAKLKAADGVIIASPVYTGNVSALMKNLMDRLAWAAHRPPFLAKPAMLVATASSGTRDTLRALEWFQYTGFEVVARVGWRVWPAPHRDWVPTPARERALRRAVERFHHAMAHPRRSLNLREVISFSVMRVTAVTAPRFFRADEAYHRDIDLLGFDVAPWKKRVGALVFRLGKAWLLRQLGPEPR